MGPEKSRLFVPKGDVVSGGAPALQGQFVAELEKQGITRSMLQGQQAGEIFLPNMFEVAYRGGNLQEAVNTTAEALKNLNP